MNKANLFKRRFITQNENKLQESSKRTNSDENNYNFLQVGENPIHSNHPSLIQCQKLLKFPSSNRRVFTQPSQMEPFSEIGNLLSYTVNKDRMKSFIKTKKVKLQLKSRNSNTQSEASESRSKKDSKYESNFQILKREIEELESMQILKLPTQTRQMNLQNTNPELCESLMDDNFNSFHGFAVTGEFSSGKNISILERQRQNIKKVMKNKKFRKYINPHKQINENFCKMTKDSFRQQNQQVKKMVSFVSFSKGQTSSNEVAVRNDNWKKKQTPQIVKKYYRPQSCNVRRESPICKSNKNKIQLGNYICMNSFSKTADNKSFSETTAPISQLREQIKTHKNKKELVILYI